MANRDVFVDSPPLFAHLAQERSGFAQEGSSGIRCVGMPSTSYVPRLRYVRGQPSFDTGTNVVPALLGRNPDELENSEDCGSAGGHGNQHVRLRGASIDASKRSARLLQRLLPWAGQAVRSPEVLHCVHQGRGSDPADVDRDPLKTAAGRRSGPDFFLSLYSTCFHSSPLVPASC